MALPVTALFAGILALWVMWLALGVVRFRRATDTSLGHGGDAQGERLIRAHANAIEAVPIFLILMALAEGLAAPVWLLWISAVVFTLGRVLHGLHFMGAQRRPLTLRFWGMIMTVTGIAVMALLDIGLSLTA